MTELRKKMEMELTLKGYSESTKRAYIAHVKRYSKHYNVSPKMLGTEEIKKYLNYLIKERKLSKSYINSAYSALKFFYERVADQNWELKKIPRVKAQKILPTVLSKNEVLLILDSLSNIKHRAMLSTIYSAGLRVSEAVALKPEDIDSERMQIRVKCGKGKKERYTILSETTLKLLREYYRSSKVCGPWLFPGKNPGCALSTRTVQRVFKKALEKSGVRKKASIHTLRHSFATHLLENGTSIRYIQKLLGHTNIKTTTVYLQVTRFDLVKIKSPLDEMGDLND